MIKVCLKVDVMLNLESFVNFKLVKMFLICSPYQRDS